MPILFDIEYPSHLEKSLQAAQKSIIFFSAYIKTSALEWIASNLTNTDSLDISIIARWQPQDLLSGASDLNAYEFAQSLGWQFAIDSKLHSKVILIDNSTIFLGSANLTSRGLHLSGYGNHEANIQIDPTDDDISKVRLHAESCVKVTEEIYLELKEYIQKQPKLPKPHNKWPKKVFQKLFSVNRLWVNDLPFSTPQNILLNKDTFDADFRHDVELLSLLDSVASLNKDILYSAFIETKAWYWLIKLLKDNEKEYVKFGEITEKLHNSILDDPKPYRKTVKQLVSNLYEWIRYLDPPELGIKKFKVTETLFLR